ncbi:hypothetical protein SAMN05421736_105188 [Evansella caseinilytica]|uniref:Type IV pilus assembly protein PilO n=1 Tax=Evansella caseinilytica TaxID=1503961 RepID=A0A1H3PS77_9BACI|nr:hypothetical protein [Evansella caseinilytica]SDZ04094.1 hypothetical protein SAMN05421736_105188 [Evansella caseinilytica]
MNIGRKKIQHFLIVLVILQLLFLVAAYVLLIVPLQDHLGSAREQLEAEEQLLQLLEQKQVDSGNLDEAQLGDFIEKVPAKPDIEHWLVQLEEIEKSANAVIESYQFSKGEGQSGAVAEAETGEEKAQEVGDGEGSGEKILRQFQAALVVTADSFDKLYDFLHKVEQMSRITKVASMTFSEPEEIRGDSVITLYVDLTAYYLPELLNEYPEDDFDDVFLQPGEKTEPFQAGSTP